MARSARPQNHPLRGKNVLVMGLGLHGGGIATVRWLVRAGGKVTVTDMRDRATLAPSLRALKGLPVLYVLGGHREKDFLVHDLVVVSPGVPRESPYLLLAKKAGVPIENVASLFFRHAKNPVIAVTGTRGKTTTTLWVAELLRQRYSSVRQSGTPEHALLDELVRVEGKKVPIIAELSSWQLEYLPIVRRAPSIAAITNIYPEHLNRYRSMKQYVDAKANIFRHQSPADTLVLNYDDPWHRYYVKKNPKGALYYISMKTLPRKLNGAYIRGEKLVLRRDGKDTELFSVKRFRRERGEHNLENLLRAVLLAMLFDPKLRVHERQALTLPLPAMREEVVYKQGRLTVVNDSAATSPEGTIAALRRFTKEGEVVLIAGGTDKKLAFDGLASVIKEHVPKKQLILLEGSATTKLIGALRTQRYFDQYEPLEYLDLASCVAEALRVAHGMKGKTVVLFSPAAASFEKFLHEFDRGKRFNALVHRALSGRRIDSMRRRR